jgi:hypothetical protein
MMTPVPEPSSRIVRGLGESTASRFGLDPGPEGSGRPSSLRLKLESTRPDDDVDEDRPCGRCVRRAEKGLGGSNSIQGSSDSRYVVRVYAASLHVT